MSHWEIILFLAAGIVSFLSGFMPFKTSGGRIPRLIFFVVAILSSICFLLFPYCIRSTGETFLCLIMFPIASFLPVAWLLLSLVFARGDYGVHLSKWKWWLMVTTILSVIFSVSSIYNSFVLFESNASGYPSILVTPIGKWFVIFVLLISSFVLINVESTYRAATGVYRRQLRLAFVLIGFFIAGIILLSSSIILYDYLSIRYLEVAALISLPLYPSIGFYLKTYQLQKSGVFIKRQAVYSSVGIILIGMYLILVGGVGKALQIIGADIKVFYSILAAFAVVVLFISLLLSSSLKKRIRHFVDRSFYSGTPVDYQDDLALFAEDISTTLNTSELVSKLSILLKEKVGIEKLWLYLEHSHLPVLTCVYPITEQDRGHIAKQSNFVDWIFRHSEAIELEDLIARFTATGESIPLEGIPEVEQVSICLPLLAKHNMVGILFLGKRLQNSAFNHQDIQFISAVGNQFALAVLSARLSEELLAARQMESFHKFSTFVIHDLKNSISMLSMLMQNFTANVNNPEFQKSAMVSLQGAVTRMQSIISKLRGPGSLETQTVSDCNPGDIVVSLRNKLKLETLDSIGYIECIDKVEPIKADIEKLTSVVENLIVNAIEAMPHGGELTVSVFETGDMTGIEVRDTGMGMEPEFINKRLFKPFETTKKKGLGIGLYQSRDQLERMGGSFHVSSKLGAGTTFRVVFPHKDVQKR